jgi:hypothetical protein
VYRDFSSAHRAELDAALIAGIDALPSVDDNAAGYLDVKRSVINAAQTGDFGALAYSRHSCRHFDDSPVDESRVWKAMEIAQRSPSVCNRQSWQVHWVRQSELKYAVLKLQEGGVALGRPQIACWLSPPIYTPLWGQKSVTNATLMAVYMPCR